MLDIRTITRILLINPVTRLYPPYTTYYSLLHILLLIIIDYYLLLRIEYHNITYD